MSGRAQTTETLIDDDSNTVKMLTDYDGNTVELPPAYLDYRDQLLEKISDLIDLTVIRYHDQDVPVEKLEDPRIITARMIAAAPNIDRFSMELGGFYTSASLATWLGYSRQYIGELAKRGRILTLKSADGYLIIPGFQFTTRGGIFPVIESVLPILLDVVDTWTAAMWFVTADDDLDGMSPVEWSRQLLGTEKLIAVAHRYAEIFRGTTS